MREFEKTQWHPPFCAAMKLELRANREDLSFDIERTLNTKPIRIDLLIVKKTQGAKIENEIGKIFEGHNIFEYKSPEDELGIDEYFKTLAYSCLYKAISPVVDGIKAEDVTISLVREGKPVELIKWFGEHECKVEEHYPGIYYVTGKQIIFPTQIIVSVELNKLEHKWLKALTAKMDMEAGAQLVFAMRDLVEKEDREDADSVLQLVLSENKEMFEKLRGIPTVCEALKTLMKPEMDAAVDAAVDVAVTAVVREKDAVIQAKEAEIQTKEAELQTKEAVIQSQNARIEELMAQVAAMTKSN